MSLMEPGARAVAETLRLVKKSYLAGRVRVVRVVYSSASVLALALLYCIRSTVHVQYDFNRLCKPGYYSSTTVLYCTRVQNCGTAQQRS